MRANQCFFFFFVLLLGWEEEGGGGGGGGQWMFLRHLNSYQSNQLTVWLLIQGQPKYASDDPAISDKGRGIPEYFM